MMPRHTGGGASAQEPCAGHCPGGGVVDDRPAFQQALLKTVGAFADIVGKTHQLTFCLRAEYAGERTAQRGGPRQMFSHCLAAKSIP